MQHGFENVGLTYTDDVHAIEKIGFAAKQIFIWGEMDSLHPACSRHTIERCTPVGCPKPTHQASPRELDTLLPVGQKIIGVFENLHWHRYTDCYREFFVDTVRHLAEKFDDYLFLVKPHHAGMWLTSRFKGDRPGSPNLLIADPARMPWERYTASQILGRLDAVITTPSTVALDAARMSLPVALISYDLGLENYRPLPQITSVADCCEFVRRCGSVTERGCLISLSEQFVRRVLISADGAARIVAIIKASVA
ncbi:MAG: hypothetical protein ACREYC_26710 [Gammaproteobacteria bacterium]